MTRWWKHCWLRGRRHAWRLTIPGVWEDDDPGFAMEPVVYECRECGRRA